MSLRNPSALPMGGCQLPVVDDENHLLGVISPGTIRQVMRPTSLLKLRRVADVMSNNIIHAPLSTTVLEVSQLMATNRVSCVIITKSEEAPSNAGAGSGEPRRSEGTSARSSVRLRGAKSAASRLQGGVSLTRTDFEDNILIPIGIITERDILQFQFLEAPIDSLVAGEVMSSPLFLLSPEDSLLKAHEQMQRRRVRRLVVSGNWGQRISIITQTSMLRVFDPIEMFKVIETLRSTVQQLEREKAELLVSESTIDEL